MFLCNKGRAIPQIKLGFFLAFNKLFWLSSGLFLALFSFLSKYLSDNPGVGFQTCEWIVLLLVFNV